MTTSLYSKNLHATKAALSSRVAGALRDAALMTASIVLARATATALIAEGHARRLASRLRTPR